MSVELNEMPYPMKGAMYWPSSATEPSWWPEWISGSITDSDIEADLDLLVVTRSNTVRVFIPYRNPNSWGFTDGAGGHDGTALVYFVRFVEIAKSKGLFVVPTIFQEMEVTEDGGFPIPRYPEEPGKDILNKNRGRHEDFIRWFMEGVRELENVPVVIVKNEPDGKGAWDSEYARHTIMSWLVDMYAVAKEVAPNIRLSSVAAAHTNLFKESLNQPVGEQSIYDIADVAMWNSFRWSDNGDWEYQIPENWLQFVVNRNVQNKPLVLSEFGWPSHYDETGVIPSNQEFDKPLGWRPNTPCDEDTQKRAYAETIAWIEMFTAQERGLHGALAWSLIDKPTPEPTSPTTYYRDPFAMFNDNRTPREAVEWFTRLYTNNFTKSGRLWQPIARAEGNALINGVYPHGTIGPPAGALIEEEKELYVQAIARIPIGIEYELEFLKIPTSNGVALINNISGGKQIHVRREEYSNRWRLFYDNEEVAASTPESPGGLVVGQRYSFRVDIGVYRGVNQYGVELFVDDGVVSWDSPEPYLTQEELFTINPNPGLFITGINAGSSELELYSIQLVRLLENMHIDDPFRPAVPDDLSTPWLDRYQF